MNTLTTKDKKVALLLSTLETPEPKPNPAFRLKLKDAVREKILHEKQSNILNIVRDILRSILPISNEPPAGLEAIGYAATKSSEVPYKEVTADPGLIGDFEVLVAALLTKLCDPNISLEIKIRWLRRFHDLSGDEQNKSPKNHAARTHRKRQSTD